MSELLSVWHHTCSLMLCSSSCSSPILRASSFFTCCSDWMALVSSMFSLVCIKQRFGLWSCDLPLWGNKKRQMDSRFVSLTTLTKPFCSSASWSFKVRFWVRARLIVALSDWTSSNMRRRSSSSWTWLSTCRSSSPRRVSCSAHRRLSCSLSRSWGKYCKDWL